MSAEIIPFPGRRLPEPEATTLGLMAEISKKLAPGTREALNAAADFVLLECELGSNVLSMTKRQRLDRIEALAQKYCAMDLETMHITLQQHPEWAGLPA